MSSRSQGGVAAPAVGSSPAARELGTVHLIGIGGVGMRNLARMLLTGGVKVTGSELQPWPVLAELRALGGVIHTRHDPSHLDHVDTVVYSSAIPSDHVELVEARRRGLRILHRSEALVAAAAGRQTLAIAGTHGKTTTSAMLTVALHAAGLDPSYVLGGEIVGGLSGGGYGQGPHVVVEADEHDRTFLRYRPHAAVVTNADSDHLNVFGDLTGLAAAFEEFAHTVDPQGFLVACADDPVTRQLARRMRAAGRTVHTYGLAEEADLRLSRVESTAAGVRYLAHLDGDDLGEFRLPLPGAHLALNSAAAALVALRLGVAPEAVAAGLADFPGVRRRFEHLGTVGGVRVFDEYAYHPTAMAAALSTLRVLAGSGRLVVVFQPFRIYRTRQLRTELAAALELADEAVVLEVFGPGEEPDPQAGGEALVEAVGLPADRKVFVPDADAARAEVVRRARPGDLVVTMGAPPIALLADQLLAALEPPTATAAAGG